MEIYKSLTYEGTIDELTLFMKALQGPSRKIKHMIILNFLSHEELSLFEKNISLKSNTFMNMIRPHFNEEIKEQTRITGERSLSNSSEISGYNLSISTSYVNQSEDMHIGLEELISPLIDDFKVIGREYTCEVSISQIKNSTINIEGMQNDIKMTKSKIEKLMVRFMNSRTLFQDYNYTQNEVKCLYKCQYTKNLIDKYKCFIKVDDPTLNDMNESVGFSSYPLAIYCLDTNNRNSIMEELRKIRILTLLLSNNNTKEIPDTDDVEFNLRRDYIEEIFALDIINFQKANMIQYYALNEIKDAKSKGYYLLIQGDNTENLDQIKQKLYKKFNKVFYVNIQRQIQNISKYNNEDNKDVINEAKKIISKDYETKLKKQKIYNSSTLLSKNNIIFSMSLASKKKRIQTVLDQIPKKVTNLFNSQSTYNIKIIFNTHDTAFSNQYTLKNKLDDLDLTPSFNQINNYHTIIHIQGLWSNICKGTRLIFDIKNNQFNLNEGISDKDKLKDRELGINISRNIAGDWKSKPNPTEINMTNHNNDINSFPSNHYQPFEIPTQPKKLYNNWASTRNNPQSAKNFNQKNDNNLNKFQKPKYHLKRNDSEEEWE